MAKHNWTELQRQFEAEHAKTAITAKDWCEANGLNYQSARRYIKVRKTAQSECAKTTAQKKSAQTAQKDKSTQKAKTDKRAKKTANDPSSPSVQDPSPEKHKSGRDEKGWFTAGNRISVGSPGNPNPPANFKPGNQAARKHGGYAARFDDTTLIEESREMSLLDELELCRARALNCIDTMKQIRLDMANATTVEQRIELYNAIASTEQALDRNVVRVESLTRTISSLRINDVNEVKITKDTARIEAATDKLRLEADKLGKEGKGNLTPLSGMVTALQSTGNNGFVGGDND